MDNIFSHLYNIHEVVDEPLLSDVRKRKSLLRDLGRVSGPTRPPLPVHLRHAEGSHRLWRDTAVATCNRYTVVTTDGFETCVFGCAPLSVEFHSRMFCHTPYEPPKYTI